MSTNDCIIAWFIRVDSVMTGVPKHPDAHRYPREIVTLALLFARKGGGSRACYRWLDHNYRSWFPGLPERTRLFRLVATHTDWAAYFLAQPTPRGVADTSGIALIHPWREDRAEQQIGRNGLSNQRWSVGAKLASVVNHYGLSVAWDAAAATAPDTAFRAVVADVQEEMVIFTDMSFPAAAGDPPHQKACKRGTWNGRMVVETIVSLLTTGCRLKQVSQRTWAGLRARLADTMAVFNVLALWDGISVDEHGNIHLSIAEFSL
jgi:hypothetical protein